MNRGLFVPVKFLLSRHFVIEENSHGREVPEYMAPEELLDSSQKKLFVSSFMELFLQEPLIFDEKTLLVSGFDFHYQFSEQHVYIYMVYNIYILIRKCMFFFVLCVYIYISIYLYK